VQSKSFDNSILCTNESTAIVEERIADALVAELGRQGAHVLDADQAGAVRAACYPDGRIDTALAGKSATALAAAAGITVPPKTQVLVAPFPLIVPEEPLAHEKLFPLLGLVRVSDVQRGIDAARALLRIGGAGHSAVIHSRDPATILAYGAALGVLRVSVNAPGSTGSAGLDTFLAPTMTIGTGFFGRSSLTENLQPRNLLQWTQVAYATDPSLPFGDFTGLEPWAAAPPAPPAPPPAPPAPPLAPPAPPLAPPVAPAEPVHPPDAGLSREELRRLILEELREVVRG
jgi:acyl-CoA reductase-like NAD-dependent aldehyde dehydrogenase